MFFAGRWSSRFDPEPSPVFSTTALESDRTASGGDEPRPLGGELPRSNRVAVRESPSGSPALEVQPEQPDQEEVEPAEPDPLDGLVEFYLGEGVTERQLVISQRLRELTAKPFEELWAKGEYEVVYDLGPESLEDELGRPRPCEVRSVDGETRVVYLSEEEHPEAWILLAAQRDALQELAKLKAQAAGPSPRKYR